MATLIIRRLKKSIYGLGSLLLIVLIHHSLNYAESVFLGILKSCPPTVATARPRFKKPQGVNVTGVVFYGRPQFVDVLDCYLRKNLVVNGGSLDNILFMVNTDNESDLEYLDGLVSQVPEYKIVARYRSNGLRGYDAIWQYLIDPHIIYIKIDDDIVWIDQDAVPRMIETLTKHPEAHDIAANIINSPITSFIHHHNGAVHPFLPELNPSESHAPPTDWRTSRLPSYDGPESESYEWDPANAVLPVEGHRWLPLHNASSDLYRTPISASEYDAWGMGWKSWAIGAQQHYSLLRNLEEDRLDRYWFGNIEGLWNMQYERYNLNFLAIRGESVARNLPGSDDEGDLTVKIPLLLKKPLLIDTHALVAHFYFHSQRDIELTDLLDRYRLYANEHVCAADNQKSRLASLGMDHH